MFEELTDMSMLSEEQVNELFGPGNDDETQEDNQGASKQSPDSEQKSNESAEDVNVEDIDPTTLFTGNDDDDQNDDSPESVGKKNQGDREGAPSSRSIPPYSSLAKALKEEGILLDLEESELEKIQNAEDFAALMEKTVQSRFDERQKRIDDALNNGVEPNVIKHFEGILKELNSVTPEQVTGNTPESETLRKNILYRDFLNKGFTEERAKRAVQQTVANGTDIDDAKEALESIKQTVKAQYQAKLDEAAAEEESVKKQQADQAKELRKGLLEDKEVFGDLEVDKAMRQKALDAIVKPIYQDPETGLKYTAIQLYEKEHRVDFLKKVGLIFAMTDNFKNLDGLVGKKVKKEVGKGMKELEDAINSSRRRDDGSLDYAGGRSDPESFLSFTLDV